MDFAYAQTLSLMDWLSFTGLFQSLLIFFYIAFRARSISQVALVLSYFFLLAAGFAAQLTLMHLKELSDMIWLVQWLIWMYGPPLCYLIIVQLSSANHKPEPKDYVVLTGVIFAVLIAFAVRDIFDVCDQGGLCNRFFDWLYLLGSIMGMLSLLALWRGKHIFNALWEHQDAHERYWLALSLVMANVFIVVIYFLRSAGDLTDKNANVALIVTGYSFVYVVTTVLFRIYPRPLQLKSTPYFQKADLTPDEKVMAVQIRRLMEREKIYQDSTFSRANLARELMTSEAILSRVINLTFNKSLPSLVHDYRIEDAKALLKDPHIPVQVVAEECGFNSLASFHRVFRKKTGTTPTQWRNDTLNNKKG